jgi:hypothetical protein
MMWDPASPRNLKSWVDHQRFLFSVLFPSHAEKQQAIRTKANASAAKNHLPARPLAPGTVAMLFDPHHRSTKLEPPYIGPYVVVSQAMPHVYWLRGKDGSILRRPVPVDQLKVLPDLKPEDVLGTSAHKWLGFSSAPADQPLPSDQYIVEKLLARRRRSGRLQYKVRWLGFNEDDDEWVDAADIDSGLINVFLAQENSKAAKHRSAAPALAGPPP